MTAEDVNELALTIKQAFYIATTGRPGPVLIDIPKDVQKAVVENYAYPDSVQLRSYDPVIEIQDGQLEKAAAAITKSRKPLLYCGQGAVASNANDLLVKLSEICDIPVTTTLLGLGCFPFSFLQALPS